MGELVTAASDIASTMLGPRSNKGNGVLQARRVQEL